MNRLRIGVALVVLVAPSCRSEPVEVPRATRDTPLEDRLVGCGQHKYPRTALRGPTGAESSDHPAAAVLRRDVKQKTGAEPRQEDEWRFLYQEDDLVIFGGGKFEELATEGLVSVYVERSGDHWDAVSSSYGCKPEVDTGGDSLIDFAFAPGFTPTSDSRALELWIVDKSCGGRDVLSRMNPPHIEYTAEAVIVLLTSRPLPEGFYTCEGFPPSPYTLELTQPVSGRAVLNGGWFPAAEPGPADGL